MKTINEKTNNPLNIRYNPANKWKGQMGSYKGFCIFVSESYGFRAAYKILCNYIANGVNTIEAIINRWAPPTENDTENYIKFVEEDTLIPRNLELTNLSIHDYWTIIIILQSMAQMECGRRYDEQQINLFINYPYEYE